MKKTFIMLIISMFMFFLSLKYILNNLDKIKIISPIDYPLFLMTPTLFQDKVIFLILCFHSITILCLIYFSLEIYKRYKQYIKTKNMQ